MKEIKYVPQKEVNLDKLKSGDKILLRNGERRNILTVNKKDIFDANTNCRISFFEYELCSEKDGLKTEESYTKSGKYNLSGEHKKDIVMVYSYYDEPEKINIEEKTFGEF